MTETTTVPLTIYGSHSQSFRAGKLAIGKNVIEQSPTQGGYWIVVIDRSSLAVVYNKMHSSPNTAPDLGNLNNTDHILVVASLSVGLNHQPQGEFFKFLDLNGAGRQLRHIEQIATQFNCGSLGTFGYALVGLLGNLNQPGFELSAIGSLEGVAAAGPFLTVQLMPITIGGKTVYTPVQLSDA